MRLSLYQSQKHEKKLNHYQLKDTTHTDSPQNIINKAKTDSNRYPIVILDDSEEFVGFFCLHLEEGPETYGFYGRDYALIRGFSIDERHRGFGYASRALDNVFHFIRENISNEVSRLILAVNEKNIIAQKAYLSSGFETIREHVPGKLGDLLIMEKRC